MKGGSGVTFPRIKRTDGLMAAVLLLYLCTFLCINFVGFAEFATPDVYADTLYAIEAAEDGSIFPDGWTFGNQYYVIGTPVLAALLLPLCGSPNLAMVLATTVMGGLVLISLDRMLAPFACRRQRLAAALAMVGGMLVPHAVTANEGQLFFLLASYYACYLITLFVTLGDWLRALAEPRPRLRGGTLLALGLLFAAGMHSLRQIAVLVLPLAALALGRMVLLLLRGRRGEAMRGMLHAALYAAANLGGVLFIAALDIPRTGMFADTVLRRAGWGEAAAVNGRILAKLTGFYYAFTEPAGWLYFLCAALFCGLLILSLVRSVGRVRAAGRLDDPFFLLQAFFLIGLLGLFALNFFFEMTYFRTIYCFTWYAFAAVSAASLFTPSISSRPRRLLAGLLASGCLCSWALGCAPDLGRCFAPQSPPVYDEMADWLAASDYRYLYGDWWLVTLVALRTDGACRAAAYHDGIFRVLPYINPQDCYGEAENACAVYLFTAGELPHALLKAAAQGAALREVAAFGDRAYIFCVSDRPLMQVGG